MQLRFLGLWFAPLVLACSGEGGLDSMGTGGAFASSGGGLPPMGSSGGSLASGGASGGVTASGGSPSSAGGTIVEQTGGNGGEPPLTGGSGGSGFSGGGGTGSVSETGGAGGSDGSGGAGVSGGGGTAAGGLSSGGTGGSGGSGGGEGCPFEGNVHYTTNGEGSWPQDARALIIQAMDEAIYYYNCYADLEKAITVNYDPGVPTAQANVDGWLTFGSNKAYMVTATAMHEVAHTLGVGYYPWQELMTGSRWTGPAVVEFMINLPLEERDDDPYALRDYITADTQHFWPYGLNQASEHMSEWSLINNVRIVAAMNEDKQAYLDGEL